LIKRKRSKGVLLIAIKTRVVVMKGMERRLLNPLRTERYTFVFITYALLDEFMCFM
jgi:hypothetical protein